MIFVRGAFFRIFKKLLGPSEGKNPMEELLVQLSSNPSDCNLLIKVGDHYLRNNQTRVAIQYFQKAADQYTADGFLTKAIAVYRRIQRLNPRLTQSRIKLSELYLSVGLLNEAKSELISLVDELTKEGRERESIPLFQKLLEIDPHSLEARSQLAATYERQGLSSEAVGLYLEISQQHIHRNQPAEALDVLKKARSLNPQNAAALWKMLWVHLEREEETEAKKLLEEFVNFHNADPEILGLVVKTFTQDAQTGRLHQLLNDILEQNPGKEAFRILKAELYLKTGSFESALAQLSFVIDQMKKRGEYNRPAMLLKRITRSDSSFYPAWKQLIDFYTVRGLEKNLPEAYSALADAYISRRMYSEAAECLRTLLKIDPYNSWNAQKLDFVRSFLVEPNVQNNSEDRTHDDLEIEINLDEHLDLSTPLNNVSVPPKKPVEITIQTEEQIEENITKAS